MSTYDWDSIFQLDPSIHFLNFGSFGACPVPVFEKYQHYQRILERDPVRFITETGLELLDESRNELVRFINCPSDDLLFVPNPTYAINLVVNSLNLKPGDEILTTNLEYGAMDYTWQFYAEKRGWHYIRQEITLPLIDKETFIQQFWQGYSNKTKVVFISHITSSTALILPVKEICQEAKKRGLICIVDGAHVPGQLPLDLSLIEADYYTGACHKWLMSPKGCSFLYLKNSVSNPLEPLIVSWGYEPKHSFTNRMHELHQYVGTNDFSSYLTISDCLQFRNTYDWENQIHISRERALTWAEKFETELKLHPLAPLWHEFFGQMISLPLPQINPEALKLKLYNEFQIQIPIMKLNDNVYIRFSIQPFVKDESLELLKNVLNETLF